MQPMVTSLQMASERIEIKIPASTKSRSDEYPVICTCATCILGGTRAAKSGT